MVKPIRQKLNNISIVYISDRNKDKDKLLCEYVKQHGGKHIEFYTNDMADLSLIAKYRICKLPTVLVFNNTKVVARMVDCDIDMIVKVCDSLLKMT